MSAAFHNDRDMNDPRYKAWRFSVFSMFNYTCCMCNQKGVPLQAHHIIRWVDSEKLRYVVSNGVALCKDCHVFVTGKEDSYRDYFQRVVRQKIKERRVLDIKRNRNKKVESKKGSRTVGLVKKAKRFKVKRNPRLRF